MNNNNLANHTFLFILSSLSVFCLPGCLDTVTPPPEERGRAEISEGAVMMYLGKADLARPEIVKAVTASLRSGKTYRRRIVDQSSKWCLTTVWIDRRNTLHIVTCRNEKCPKCHGTGKRVWDNKRMQGMPFDTRCLKCDGKGFLEHYTVERKYALSPMDFENPEAARRAVAASAYRNAPPEAQRYVEMLAAGDPGQRLRACIWLDRNYVRTGMFFHDIQPMLRKARQRDRNKKVMVWQFWAGRGLPDEYARTYYRIYAHTKSGRIFKKGFYPEQ